MNSHSVESLEQKSTVIITFTWFLARHDAAEKRFLLSKSDGTAIGVRTEMPSMQPKTGAFKFP